MRKNSGNPRADLKVWLKRQLLALGAELAAGTRLHLRVALSGGLDSSVLLHALAALRDGEGFDLSAAHVHHGLSRHADDWAQACQNLCDENGVPLTLTRVAVLSANQGLEDAARNARYKALLALPQDVLALAHHRGDQAETLLQRLLRGTGTHGGGGMREFDAARSLWRPMLELPRSVLLAYAQAHGLHWVDDASNADVHYTRNFFRHEVLPLLQSRFPNAEVSLARACAQFAEDAALLDEMALSDKVRVQPGAAGARQALRDLVVESPARARCLLRFLLRELGGRAPSRARLDEALSQLIAPADAVHQVVDGCALCAWRDDFWVEYAAGAEPQDIVWQGETALPWGMGQVLFAPGHGVEALRISPEQGLRLSVRAEGDRLRPVLGRPRRDFQTLCQQASVPPWWRTRLPVLRSAQQPLWMGGVAAEAALQCAEGEAGWCLHWQRDQGVRGQVVLSSC